MIKSFNRVRAYLCGPDGESRSDTHGGRITTRIEVNSIEEANCNDVWLIVAGQNPLRVDGPDLLHAVRNAINDNSIERKP